MTPPRPLRDSLSSESSPRTSALRDAGRRALTLHTRSLPGISPFRERQNDRRPPAIMPDVNDWEQFLDEVPWFLSPGESAAIDEPQPWTRGSVDKLPELSALLAAATVTAVSVGSHAYELLAWGPPGARRGWLCHRPHGTGSNAVASVHADFWKLCGGIGERFREPVTWWMNQNEVLTIGATALRVADLLDGYLWLWHAEGMKLPIDPDEYYVVAVEANGNLTLAARNDGRLVLFAPDHCFSGVTPLAGSPPYSLMTIDHAPDLTAWIEMCAAAWREP